jgi:hypothetical protein
VISSPAPQDADFSKQGLAILRLVWQWGGSLAAGRQSAAEPLVAQELLPLPNYTGCSSEVQQVHAGSTGSTAARRRHGLTTNPHLLRETSTLPPPLPKWPQCSTSTASPSTARRCSLPLTPRSSLAPAAPPASSPAVGTHFACRLAERPQDSDTACALPLARRAGSARSPRTSWAR